MKLWYLIFLFPYEDGWLDVEDKLAKHITSLGGEYEAGATFAGRREVCGIFATKEKAVECGKAAHDLYIQFLSWSTEEIQVTN